MVEFEDKRVTIGIASFIAIGLAILFLFPFAESKTIILTPPITNFTESCAAPNLVLAQNLTDLCDVTIISPASGQLIQYNGTQWINVSNATITESTVCNNLGTSGTIICAGGNVDLKRLLEGTGITLSNNATHIMITNSAPDNTVCANIGTGADVYKDGECNFRTILGSPDISVTENANDITIDYNGTLATESTVCTNTGTGNGLCNGGNVQIKSLIAGSGITISDTTDDYTIINASPEATACTNVGTGNQLCSGGNVNLDTLIAGTGITITDTTDDWTFASQCANTGTGEAVCESSNNINSLIAGTGISIADTTGDLTITNTVTDTNSCTNTGTGEAICESANNINSLIAGNSITITDTTGDLTITPTIQKLCETIASGGETTLTCTLSGNSKAFIIQTSFTSTQADTWVLRFNGDSGSNYNIRSSTNGGADATSGAVAHYATVTITANQWYHYVFKCEQPLTGQEKHCVGFRTTSATGAGNADARVEFASKWANTANQITDTELVRTAGTGTMTAGSYIIVWGTT